MNNLMDKQKFLLVELSETPRFWLTCEIPDARFLLDGIEYTDAEFGDFLGFYDYLRNAAGEILGVRFLPFEDYGFSEKELLLLASENKDFDEKKSDDQRFGENKLYHARNGNILLTFAAPDEKFTADCKVFQADFSEIYLKAA